MGGNEVRNQELLLTRLQRELVKQRLELLISAHTRLHHLAQGALLGVLRGNLEVTAHMVLHQFLDVLRALHRQVVTHA